MQAEDMIAEAFATIGDQGQARKHCEASIKVVISHPQLPLKSLTGLNIKAELVL
jgi:hypothetical protein